MESSTVIPRRFAVADLVALGCAVVLLLMLALLPWVNQGEDGSITGLDLVFNTPPKLQEYASGLFILAAATVIGGLAALIALWRPRSRRVAAAFVFACGVLVLVYYVLFFLNNTEALGDLIGALGLGFWVGLVAAVGLVAQLFIPRPPLEGEANPVGLYFLLPGVVWLLLFTLFPLVFSLGLSFTDKRMGRGARQGDFIGFDNYIEIFGDNRVQEVMTTTIFLIVGSVFLTMLLGTFIAWLFNQDIPGLRTFRAILTMPLFAAPIALGYLGMILFNEQSGPINYLIQGLGGEQIYWITQPWAARMAVLIVDTWQWTPFVFIVVLAAMQSVPNELYEAAQLDTSSSWTMFWQITFPMITPAMGTVAMLRLVETFKILDIPFTLTGGGPGTSTQTYSFYTYLEGLRFFDMGYGSALAWLLVVVAIIISSIYFWRVRDRFDVA